jgi:uncharacterized membrane protein
LNKIIKFAKIRFRSYAFWVSLISFVGLIVNLKYPTFKGQYDLIANSFLGFLSVAGIANNNNTKSQWYGEK